MYRWCDDLFCIFYRFFFADETDLKMSSSVVKPVYVPKVKSSPVGDMSAYYSDDNSDDDFKMPTKKRTKVSIVFFLYYHLWCSIFLLIDVQISKSPPEKPLVSIRPSSVGSSVVPIKMEDMKTERVMLSSDGGSVESPVEQPFIQRKQKYSSSLCQPADKSR